MYRRHQPQQQDQETHGTLLASHRPGAAHKELAYLVRPLAQHDTTPPLLPSPTPVVTLSGGGRLASCRKDDDLSELSGQLNLFQPNLRVPCVQSAKCQLQHDYRHTHHFQHPKPDRRPGAAGEEMPDEFEHCGVVTDVMGWMEEDSPPVPSLPRNCHVIVFVHGLAFRAYKMLNALRQLHLQFHNHLCLESVCVVGFSWPSCRPKAAYHQAKANASIAAPVLLKLISVLKAHGNAVHLIGHSLGVRVVLLTLQAMFQVERPISAAARHTGPLLGLVVA